MKQARTLVGAVAWVTGGATGIGRATARTLAADGARVAISGRRQAELDAAVEAMRAEGLDVTGFRCDVADPEQVVDTAARVAREIGPVTHLVCSAGTNVPNRFWKDTTAASFAQVVAVNLNGVMQCVHAVLPGMRDRGGGVIAVVSSWAGREFLPFTGLAYGASKTALGPLVESINFEEGRRGIRASLIMPGEVATPILKSRPVRPPAEDLERMLTPEDLADLIHYICTAPPHVCLGEVLIGPTYNRIYVGADDLKPKI